jgi:16S rRNA (guanine527-N7)-methyltransferase
MTLRRILIDGAAVFGVDLNDSQIDACLVYLVELEKWNRKINLTAIRDEQEIVTKHFIDSFSYLKGFVTAPHMELLDMGSGAGFPALPIKIAAPDISVTLVESVRKKGAFLRHVIRTLRLERATVLDARIDSLSGEHLTHYDVVTARAFADMETALREGAPFLKPGGVMVLSRGPAESVGTAAVVANGMSVRSRDELILPRSLDPRALWVFQKNA